MKKPAAKKPALDHVRPNTEERKRILQLLDEAYKILGQASQIQEMIDSEENSPADVTLMFIRREIADFAAGIERDLN